MIDSSLVLKFIRFSCVGFSGVVIDFSTTYIFKEKLKLYKLIANAIGFVGGASTTFYFNRIFTFHSNNPEVFLQYFKFIVVSSIGLSINTVIIYLLSEKKAWNFYLSKVAALVIVVFWNFFANNYYTFK